LISFQIQIAGIDNAQLKPLVESLQSIQNFEAKAVISGFNFDHLIPFKLSSYYRYNGSLTTPTCDEVVTWSVNDSPIIDISENQLIAFQSLTDTNGYQVKALCLNEQLTYEHIL
jgi:carbonic anhydrase